MVSFEAKDIVFAVAFYTLSMNFFRFADNYSYTLNLYMVELICQNPKASHFRELMDIDNFFLNVQL